MNDFIQRFKNARKAIQQIRDGEWVPRYNEALKMHAAAYRGDLMLWLGSDTGAWFVEIDPGYFGLFWRHYVYWAAARKLKRDANRAMKQQVPVL